MDIYDKEKRSEIMSKVKTKNTKPEILLRKHLYASGIRGYRVNYKILGTPDIVFTKYKLALFVDGCFWHGCPVCYKEPKTQKEFWYGKLNENINRDKRVNNKLKENGWQVLRLWEHEVEKRH